MSHSLQLSSPLTDVSGVGPAKMKAFQKLGIRYVRDLLFHFPRRYDDFSQCTSIASLEVGSQMTVRGRIRKVDSKYGFYGKKRLLRVYADVEDDTGILHVVWFNLRFLTDKLKPGMEIYVAGKVEPYKYKNVKNSLAEFSMRSPAIEFSDEDNKRTHTAAITPIYPETQGVSSRFMRYQIKKLLPLVRLVPEYMPKEIIKRQDLVDIHTALRAIHFPESQEELSKAKHRLVFDELFFLQLAALVRRSHLKRTKAQSIQGISEDFRRYLNDLPFELTKAQEKAIEEVLEDMKCEHPMNRLLQGDVGSGKSAIALLATKVVLGAGYKTLYLAPTEILARQQYESFKDAMLDTPIQLLIGAMKSGEKERVKKRIQDKEPCCVIGTHALLQEDVRVKDVGLVIVDEQHRFGVAQRKALQDIMSRSGEQDRAPHLLSMTATPIPRTLNLTVFGDLDVSVLNELPPGRMPIETRIVSPDEQDHAITHVLEEIHQGRQAYVIAPLVEDSDKLEVKSAKKVEGEMKKMFPGIAIGLVHGQLKSEDKEAVMRNFASGAIQLLVSTAVVEVGVNVPNASIMIIEGAERFGLAQLHQFRGRIGRGKYQSYCYVFPSTKEATESERLKVFERIRDGFTIAEEDLRLRGPGEMYGVEQSGFGNMKVASLLDYKTIKEARSEADRILNKDANLQKYPILQKKIEQKNMHAHFE